MDFGQVGIDGFVGQGQDSAVPGFGQEPKTKSSGSGLAKKERSIGDSGPVEVVDCRASKVSRGAADGLVLYKTLPVHHQGNPGLRSTSSQPEMQMLSFSSPKQEVSFLSEESGRAGVVAGAGACGFGDKSAQNMPLSYYQYTTPSAYTRNSGFVCGTMNGSFTGTKGPFTPAQWIELEHQALIYKYLDANVPVPANLLIPIKKALFSTGFSGFAAASFPPHPHPYGWGPFHLGFSGGTDPEPGRCRRTDGKKWRCSREAVPDQKYCERHMNRSRHRSRKPVEGQKGQVASAPTNTKVVPVPVSMSSSLSSSVTANGCASNNPAIARNQFKGLEAGNTNPSYTITERHQDSQGLPMVPPNVSQKSKESPFSILKQDITFEEYHQQEFGIVSSDSLLNPSQKSSYVSSSRDDKLFPDFSDQRMKNEHPLRHFIDEWPKTQTDHSSGAWSEELRSDWTQLSISIPVSLDFSSSSSSPDVHKTSLSSLRSSRGNLTGLSWGNPMGGPLAEVINKAGSSARPYKNTSVLNFMGEGWDGSSPMGSSPTDVLQKATFISLSNSSSGSSPIADYKKTQESAGLCNDLLG